MAKNQLSALREQITALDLEFISLLSKRQELITAVANVKKEAQLPLRDKERENTLLELLTQTAIKRQLDPHYVKHLFQSMIEHSVTTQKKIVAQSLVLPAKHTAQTPTTSSIAFLGPKGSYSHLAAKQYMQYHTEHYLEYSCEKFKDIFTQVQQGRADYAIVPIENTSSGSINEIYDLLQTTDLSIVGELTYPINHCLLVATETKLENIDTVYSHPQPVEQCRHYLEQFDWHINYCASTATAMQQVACLSQANMAAIGSIEGGQLYHLTPLQTHLANQQQNITRFIILASAPVSVNLHHPAKTSLIFSTGQQAGSLVEPLIVFKNRQIVITKLESRPIDGIPWEEMFYIDVKANLQDENMQQALHELQPLTRFLKVFGSYPLLSSGL